MELPLLDQLAPRNLPGACFIDVVDINDVQTFPAEVSGNIAGAVVLKSGKTWHRIRLSTPGSRFLEKWVHTKGTPFSDTSISGFLAKDELAKLQTLWNLPITRFLVHFHGHNNDHLLAGTPTEGCMGRVSERDRGDESSLQAGYRIEFGLRRWAPVPFYGMGGDPPPEPGTCAPVRILTSTGTVVDYAASGTDYSLPAPTVCPTLGALLAEVTSMWDVIALLSPEQIMQLQEIYGGGGGGFDEVDGGGPGDDWDDEIDGG